MELLRGVSAANNFVLALVPLFRLGLKAPLEPSQTSYGGGSRDRRFAP